MDWIIRFTVSTTFKDHVIVGETKGECITRAGEEAASYHGKVTAAWMYKYYQTLEE